MKFQASNRKIGKQTNKLAWPNPLSKHFVTFSRCVLIFACVMCNSVYEKYIILHFNGIQQDVFEILTYFVGFSTFYTIFSLYKQDKI